MAFWLISNFRRRVEGFEVIGAPGGGTDPLEYSFDAFGKRRNTNWTPDNSDALQTATLWNHRGYTDHEQLDNVRLIHLGGRVYDPKLGRFLSADPVLGDFSDPQSLNPYSYVANNPLAYTDPSGLFLSKVFKAVKRAIRSAGSFGRRLVRNYGREITAAVVAYVTAGAVQSWVLTAPTAAAAEGVAIAGTGAAAFQAGSTLAVASTQASVIGWTAGGAVGGAIATKSAKGAFWGGVSGGAFAGVGAAFGGQYNTWRVLTEGAVGGASAAAQGGEFWQGFGLSATSASAEYAYQSIVRYGTDWGPGGEAPAKGALDRPINGANNIGTQGYIGRTAFWKEGGFASNALNLVPGINAVAGMHDVFQIKLGTGRLRDIFNIPGMPVAAAITYPALMHGNPSVWLALEDD